MPLLDKKFEYYEKPILQVKGWREKSNEPNDLFCEIEIFSG